MKVLFYLAALLFLVMATGGKADVVARTGRRMIDGEVNYEPPDPNPYSQSGNREERRMAMSIVKALERQPVPENQAEIEQEAKAEKIIKEVEAEYDNIAKQINQLNADKRRYRKMQKAARRKHRLALRRKFKKFYARQ